MRSLAKMRRCSSSSSLFWVIVFVSLYSFHSWNVWMRSSLSGYIVLCQQQTLHGTIFIECGIKCALFMRYTYSIGLSIWNAKDEKRWKKTTTTTITERKETKKITHTHKVTYKSKWTMLNCQKKPIHNTK